MNSEIQRYTALAGRILLAFIFLKSGYGKITGWEQTAEHMAGAGMPLVPFFLLGAIVLEIVGGILLITGFGARFGAAALVLFLIPTTFIFHAFWAVPPDQVMAQQMAFIKNLAILGGLLNVLALGAGPAISTGSTSV
jgi:putative oxidoreductase